jgi:hypothetical protein
MSKPIERAILIVLIAAVLIGDVIATHNLLTRRFPGHNDFMVPWEAARGFWLDNVPVYSPQSTDNIQTRIYGHPVGDSQFPNYYSYPFYTLFEMLPLVFFSYDWASAIWMVLLEACLVGALFLLIDLYRWKPGPVMLALLVVWTLAVYPAARSLILGQVSTTVYFFEVLAIWALVKRRDGLAGTILAFSTLKPQMGFLIVPFLLLWALSRRRFRFVRVFIISFVLLVGLSFTLQPSWLGGWLFELRRYESYTAVGSPVWVIAQYYLHLGSVGELVLDVPFVLLALWSWYSVILRRQNERWMWAVALTLAVTHLVAPRTATPHFIVYAIPFVFYLAVLARRGRIGWAVLLLIAVLALPWLHFAMTVQGEFESAATYLPIPFLSLIALWLTRRLWWRAALAPELP